MVTLGPTRNHRGVDGTKSYHEVVEEAEICCVQISKGCLSNAFERIRYCTESLSTMVIKHSNCDSFLMDGRSYGAL